MLQALMQEQIINEVAPHPPYNIAIQDQEIEQFLRRSSPWEKRGDCGERVSRVVPSAARRNPSLWA